MGTLNLTTPVARALSLIFGLGTDIVKSASFVRPPGLNPLTGAVAVSEQIVSCSIVVEEVKTRAVIREPISWILVRATEIAAVNLPGRGDYFVITAARREIIEDPILDPTGQFYQFKTTRSSVNEDWGDLSAHTSAADWGDLTAETTAEDWGGLPLRVAVTTTV